MKEREKWKKTTKNKKRAITDFQMHQMVLEMAHFQITIL